MAEYLHISFSRLLSEHIFDSVFWICETVILIYISGYGLRPTTVHAGPTAGPKGGQAGQPPWPPIPRAPTSVRNYISQYIGLVGSLRPTTAYQIGICDLFGDSATVTSHLGTKSQILNTTQQLWHDQPTQRRRRGGRPTRSETPTRTPG
jgi:hypothetical protein